MSWKVVTLFLVAALAGAAGDQGTEKAAEGLKSTDAAVRAKAQDEIRSAYDETVQALEALVEETLKDYEEEKVGIAFREGKGYDPKYRPAAPAMQLLGEMRAVHAVPLLVRHLDFFCPVRERLLTTGASPEEIPALGALIKIGLPSVRPVLDRYKKNECIGLVAYWLVKGVLVREGIAEAYLTRAVAEEQDPQEKDRLQFMLDRVKGK